MDVFALPKDQQAVRDRAAHLFARVRAELEAALPADCHVLHVGATAIPDCLTKGDLDLVVRCKAADFAKADRVLADRFARNLESLSTANFSAFEDASSVPPCGVQLTVSGGPLDVFHLFANALRNDPILVGRYNALKRRYDGRSMNAYRNAKAAFVHTVLGLSADHPSAAGTAASGETE
jgi:GrpB-like predicted nucleotidyltransferase (UPF0157 family)